MTMFDNQFCGILEDEILASLLYTMTLCSCRLETQYKLEIKPIISREIINCKSVTVQLARNNKIGHASTRCLIFYCVLIIQDTKHKDILILLLDYLNIIVCFL